ncbi:MAG: transcriptional repressor [Candidatus Eisenbacteria bacterium]|nr:transcriptional repressor [Candidatus Eisenbacteria bacterium]
MDNPDTLREVMRKGGLRWTPQRRAIIATLWQNVRHPSADEIFASAKRRHSRISRATVYNTLEALVGAGQIRVIPDAGGRRRYDPNTDPHSHLHCVICGLIADLPAGDLAPPPKLRGGNGRGFRVLDQRVEILGHCPRCAGRKDRLR